MEWPAEGGDNWTHHEDTPTSESGPAPDTKTELNHPDVEIGAGGDREKRRAESGGK